MLRVELSLATILLIPIIVTFLPSVSGAKDTYYVYVDELPSWSDNAGNAAFKATEFWMDNNDWLNFYKASSPATADIHIQWVKEFGTETVGHAVDKWFVEVGLGDSVCYEHWQPFSANYVNYITTHEIGHVLGVPHSDDPNSIMYPIAYNLEYGVVEQKFTLTENYAQYVGFCTIKDVTTLEYWVSVDDPTYGFDVYVVPSADSLNDWSDGKSFKVYTEEGCSSKNYRSVGGTCKGISKGSGLLIIMDSELTSPLTKINVIMQEVATPTNFAQPRIELEEPDLSDILEGSPVEDSDNDGIWDDIDNCRYEPESYNGFLDFDGCPDEKPVPTPEKPDESEYRDLAYTSMSIYKTRIDELKSGIKVAEDSLSGLEYTNPNAKGKIGQAWTQSYNAQQHLEEIERTWSAANYEISKKNYKSAFNFFKGIDSESEKIGNNLQWISSLIADAKQLENESQTLKNIPDFIDPKKGAQYYIDRYNNEPDYRQWFHKNYPNYSIEEAIETAIPGAFSKKETKPNVPDFVDPEKGVQYYLDRYNNEPDYKEWFDKNYPDYTIEEAIVRAIPDALSEKQEEKEKFCFLFWCW